MFIAILNSIVARVLSLLFYKSFVRCENLDVTGGEPHPFYIATSFELCIELVLVYL